MAFNPELVAEMEILALFNLANLQEGLKIHHTATPQAIAAARRLPAPPPVILMTGFGYDPNHCIVRASQEGLQAVLFKPFRVESLLVELRRAVGRVHSA